jgi:hypothetical protein
VVSTDGQSITVTTDKDGRASVRPIAGNAPGIVKIISEAVLPNNAIAGQVLFQLSVLERKSGPTKFRGVVMSHTGKPLAGVRLTISRTNLSVTSDATGKFEFTSQVPPGKIDLFVDGRTVTPIPNVEYPALHFETAIIQGQDNQLPHAIYLPPVNLSAARVVGGNADVTLTIPGYEGFELVVKANSVTFPDGSRTGNLVISPVHNDRLPMVPPGGAATFGTLGWTIQPTGTRFDPPAEVKIPNPGNMKAGQTAEIVQWDHDLATFIPMGLGTVNENASQIITDAGSGITKAGWGGCPGILCGFDPGFPQCGTNPPAICRGGDCGPCNECEIEGPAVLCPQVLQCLPNIPLNFKDCDNMEGTCFNGTCIPDFMDIVEAKIELNKITIRLPPFAFFGKLKVKLVKSDDTEYALPEIDAVPGAQTVPFNPEEIPKGDYVSIKAIWSGAEDTMPYRFRVLGKYRHTLYNTPRESECIGGEARVILLSVPRTGQTCREIEKTINSIFQDKVELNGSGLSINHGIIQLEYDCPKTAPNFRDSGKYRQKTAPVGANGSQVNDTTVAIREGRDQLQLGARLLILSGGIGEVKTAVDKCPDCIAGPNDDGQEGHVDNYSSSITRCNRVVVDYGNFKTIELKD